MIYDVTIRETLEKTIPITAQDMIEAYDKAKLLYKNSQIILLADDMVDYSIYVGVKENDTKTNQTTQHESLGSSEHSSSTHQSDIQMG